MKRFKRKQKKLKEKQTARLIAESPLTCALDIWQARKEARAKAEYALSHEDFLMAEADLVHHLNRLKASTGLDEKKSELVEEQKEMALANARFDANLKAVMGTSYKPPTHYRRKAVKWYF